MFAVLVPIKNMIKNSWLYIFNGVPMDHVGAFFIKNELIECECKNVVQRHIYYCSSRELV